MSDVVLIDVGGVNLGLVCYVLEWLGVMVWLVCDVDGLVGV